jgi:DNA repair exonuclease SbcCD ATPase subunit
MKITAIELEGFWGYREHTRIDVDGLPLVVAVGKNGTGKSALVVHAVLAGLYGKFPTRTVEESITDGAALGTVAVEFTLHDTAYRVIRTHPRSGAAAAAVHRFVDGEWTPLTEKGVREATAKVTELLGMPYETAVMTWVAEQGQYGLFANALPAQRFKLLAAVFDLGKYAPLHKAAQDMLRKAKEDAANAAGRVQELTDDVVDDDGRTATCHEARSDADLAAAAISAHDALADATATLATHENADPHAVVERARAALSRETGNRQAQLARANIALETARAARAAAPSRHETARQAAQQRHDAHVIVAEQDHRAAAQHLTQRMTEAEAAIAALDAASAAVPTIRAAVTAANAQVERAQAAVEAASDIAAAGRAHTARALAGADAARAAVTEAEEALRSLAHAGDCYACGQHLTEALAASLRSAQDAVIAERERTLTAAVAAHARAQGDQEAQLEAIHTARAALDAAQREQNAAAQQLAEAQHAEENAAQRRAALDYDRGRLAEANTKLEAERVRLATELEQALAAAEQAHAAELADITAAGQAAAADVNAFRKPTEHEQTLAIELDAVETAANNAPAHAATTAQLRTAREQARAHAAALDAESGRRAEVARRHAEQGARIAAAKTALDTATEQVTVHADLVTAYSPAGIPAMVLESVIDDLNAAINVTLAELSGGALTVRLTTARETAGGAQESKVTVYVDTPTGTRSYEALSGGQRFRVDIAIRMGLSAIVAAGTGTPIETFIVDEGWGALDEDGIRSTLEVLHRLSEQVNVATVSHIDSVRDAFPARIEVTANEGTGRAVVVR